MADEFASRGYLTVVPDLFDGGAIGVEAFFGAKVDLKAWVENNPPEKIDPVIKRVVEHLKTDFGVERVGGVGYCFGGRVSEI